MRRFTRSIKTYLTMSYKVNQEVIFNNKVVKIVERIKGNKTNKRNMQSGILCIGYKSASCTYILSSGQRVQGSKLKKV